MLNMIDMDYRKTVEYKTMQSDNDIISGSSSTNPRFWRFLKKKHEKQINIKSLKKCTFSFEKARYAPLLSPDINTAITPCSSPRFSSKNEITTTLDKNHVRSAS